MIKFSLPMQVFMPFQVKQQHWIVVVIMNKEEEFQILDSSWKLQDYEPEIKKLIHGIAYIAKTVPTAPQNVGSWNIIQKQNVPKQTDGSSCGLYIIKYMELWNGSRLLKEFTQADIDNFRKEMAAQLIFAEANEALGVKEAVEALMSREDADS
ncbi:sentrin-specific protease-like [Panicum hallii]|uniref:sentrin-specific protease-like n=1 Tax=Panicum hallii TaxID=206008 RepID=UPI000DF4CDA5|nr:sentrin-specific protease-like [Panicum hallii]